MYPRSFGFQKGRKGRSQSKQAVIWLCTFTRSSRHISPLVSLLTYYLAHSVRRMNIRGGLKVSRDAAVVFARTFRRDRQRSLVTVPLPTIPPYTPFSSISRLRPSQGSALSTPASGAGYHTRRFSHGATAAAEVDKQAWLGNAHGGLRRGDKGEYLFSSSLKPT
jgi:hypothetical protein